MAKRANPKMTDEENPALTSEDFAAMRPARDALPLQIYDSLVTEQKSRGVGKRGPGRKPAKVALTIRVDPEVLMAWRASGEGWQRRARELLAREAPNVKRRV